MKSFTVCSYLLFIGMAATTFAKTLVPASSTEEKVDMEKLTHTVEELASRPVYAGPYETTGTVSDDPLAPALTNDTDETDSVDKRVKRWVNDFDGVLYFICPNTDSISRISSYHNNHHEDRRFSISCKGTFNSSPHCYESGWVNNFDQYFSYTCPANYAIAGMISYHDNKHEDRRFQFRCCGASGHLHTYCYWTSYVNSFDEYFEWSSDSKSFLAGVSSYHDNHHEDRRFRFYVCLNIGA